MRVALTIFIFVFSSGVLSAQETESRMQKILNPEKNRASNLQTKSFYGGKSFTAGGAATVKEFYTPQRFASMNFATRQFYGATSHWSGNMKFDTAPANTKGRFTIPNADKAVSTKAVPVADARDAQKGFASKSYAGTKAGAMHGKAQGSIDREYNGRAPMTLDDVRDLLNKNK